MDASAWVAVVAAVISLGTAGVASWQARSAKTQADAAKRQADAATRQTELQEQICRDSHQPYVWADFRPDPHTRQMIRLVLHNEGPTVAEDVRVVFDPPLRSPDRDVRFAERASRLLDSTLPSMPPGRELSWNFARGFTFSEDNEPLQYTVTIAGRGPYGDMPTLQYTLDLRDLLGTAGAPDGSLHAIAEAVKDLRKSVDAASVFNQWNRPARRADPGDEDDQSGSSGSSNTP
jgi:hypothetical protein